MLDNFYRRYSSGNRGVSIDSFVNSARGMLINRKEKFQLEGMLKQYDNISAEIKTWFLSMFSSQTQK